MRRFASSVMALAIGLTPAAGVMAAEDTQDTMSNPSSSELSLDLLGITDFALNPSGDTWLSVIQQIRAHPCYHMVGDEKDMCKDRYGLTTDLSVMMSRTDFAAWIRNSMIDSLCGQTGQNRASCIAGIPMLTAQDLLNFEGGASVAADWEIGADMTRSNESLFKEAGTAPTTRQNALDIIEENDASDDMMTSHERATLLWNECEGSHMGQSGCYHSFSRYIEDESIDIATIRDVIDRNGRSGDRN